MSGGVNAAVIAFLIDVGADVVTGWYCTGKELMYTACDGQRAFISMDAVLNR